MGNNRSFDDWLSSFIDTIASYSYYVDFEKVIRNAESKKRLLHLMNSLIGSKKIEYDFRELIGEYPEVLECVPILLAVREHEIKVLDNGVSFHFNFTKPNYTIDEYVHFMDESGLFDLISNHLIANLYDYVLGVEAGLDSNGRKNRGGHLMENLVESYIKKDNLIYAKEMYASEIEQKTGIDLSAISNGGTTDKRFDYVIFDNNEIYAIEVNFYSSGGSKLNETARSYKTLTLESKEIPGFHFVWFTDGKGWISARNNLRETFDVLDNLYCINDLKHYGVKKLLNL